MVIHPNRFTLNELADAFRSQDTNASVEAIITMLDEKAFKSSRTDYRGEFREMCGLKKD